MLFISGDTDLAVSTTGTLAWLKDMNQTVLENWRSYSADNQQVAGFTVKYEGLIFATVKGAGHMVPMDKPQEALYLLKKFINGQPI